MGCAYRQPTIGGERRSFDSSRDCTDKARDQVPRESVEVSGNPGRSVSVWQRNEHCRVSRALALAQPSGGNGSASVSNDFMILGGKAVPYPATREAASPDCSSAENSFPLNRHATVPYYGFALLRWEPPRGLIALRFFTLHPHGSRLNLGRTPTNLFSSERSHAVQ